MRLFHGLLGARLPHVGSEDLSAGSEHDVRAGVMSLELHATVFVDLSVHLSALQVSGNVSVKLVHNDFADLDDIDDVDHAINALNGDSAKIVLLAT